MLNSAPNLSGGQGLFGSPFGESRIYSLSGPELKAHRTSLKPSRNARVNSAPYLAERNVRVKSAPYLVEALMQCVNYGPSVTRTSLKPSRNASTTAR